MCAWILEDRDNEVVKEGCSEMLRSDDFIRKDITDEIEKSKALKSRWGPESAQFWSWAYEALVASSGVPNYLAAIIVRQLCRSN
jgi:hypothetical protein